MSYVKSVDPIIVAPYSKDRNAIYRTLIRTDYYAVHQLRIGHSSPVVPGASMFSVVTVAKQPEAFTASIRMSDESIVIAGERQWFFKSQDRPCAYSLESTGPVVVSSIFNMKRKTA